MAIRPRLSHHRLREVAFWHFSAVLACRRNVRCCGKTGSDVLVLSLTAHDPSETSRFARAISRQLHLLPGHSSVSTACIRWHAMTGENHGGG
jgi:hypothetical protein